MKLFNYITFPVWSWRDVPEPLTLENRRVERYVTEGWAINEGGRFVVEFFYRKSFRIGILGVSFIIQWKFGK